MNEQRVNKFTPEQKTEWWGEGEWVNETDLITFEHKGIECMVLRISMEEPDTKDFHVFGGYLCGYVSVPSDHYYYQKRYEDINIDCHGGLTFGECSEVHWIGFDCAHLHDYVPSTEHMKKTAPWMQEYRKSMEYLKKKFNIADRTIFRCTYKNIEYCIQQCKSIADQLIGISKNGEDVL